VKIVTEFHCPEYYSKYNKDGNFLNDLSFVSWIRKESAGDEQESLANSGHEDLVPACGSTGRGFEAGK